MSDSWEKNREAADALPRPELNPLVNPVLEHNLGRWAEVYFTSPPEKREQAIIDLLMELQSTNEFQTNQQSGPTVPALRQESEPQAINSQESGALNLTRIVCACHFENFAGQRFCGGCGAHLLTNAPPPPTETQVEPAGMSALPEPPSSVRFYDPPANGNDVGWLREKAFSQWDEVDPPARRGKMLALAGFILAVLCGVMAYTYWPRHDQSTQALPAETSVPPAAAAQQPQAAPVEAGAPPALENSPAREAAPVRAETQTREQKPRAPRRIASAVPAASSEDGAQELYLAEQNLDAKNGSRDSAQAARLLWKAVGKQNAQASLLLSDLYARGDGVAKNCDQARLLLVAAARKGTPAAAQQLRSLESNGCR